MKKETLKKYLALLLALASLSQVSSSSKKNVTNVNKEENYYVSTTLEEPKECNRTENINKSDVLFKDEITITAVGDCTFGSDKVYNYYGSFNQMYDQNGPEYFFENVKQVFINDDFTIVNLECALTSSNNYADKQYVYKGEEEYAKILSSSSVELAGLANNHTFDYLQKGFDDTIEALESENIKPVYEDMIQIMQKNGVKIAFISVCSWSTSESELKSYFDKADALGVSAKVLCVHWGSNYEVMYNSSQQNYGRMAVDLGADLVLGSHAHILQGTEVYKGVPIIYSLGNFCYGGIKRVGKENDTMIYQTTFYFENGILKSQKGEIIPAYMSSSAPVNDYKPMVVEDEKEKQRILKYIKDVS